MLRLYNHFRELSIRHLRKLINYALSTTLVETRNSRGARIMSVSRPRRLASK